MSFNESTAYAKFWFEVSWGTNKVMFLDKFSFGDEFFYAEPIAGKPQFVRNPLFIYPVARGIETNPAARVLDEFYYSHSILPKCKIFVDISDHGKKETIPQYKFVNVLVRERYGGGGSRRVGFYKLEFDDWSYK
jgi:hypothetical protein